ncbi:hypothetical protein HDU87_008771 [Geranomyces variabilis]|uniref:Uncharacterized protein n=1 Tax=Geranomyces variabilis TaxID=109894 RepID=A0AAD5TCN3_9FUNG|nr:hypothetical protein HDU87_008771 [Geranomyces variabilis]
MDDPLFVSAVKATTLSWTEYSAELQSQLDKLPKEKTRNSTEKRQAKRLMKWLGRASEFNLIKGNEAEERKMVLDIHKAQVGTTTHIVNNVFPTKRPANAMVNKTKKAKTTATQPLSPSATENRKDASDEQTDFGAQDLAACRAMLLKISPKLEGIYLIRLGRLKDLRVPMAITNGDKDNDCRLKEWIDGRGWRTLSSGPETLKDGSKRKVNRVEVIVVPAKFVPELRKQYETLLDDLGGLPLAAAVEALEQAGERERTLNAALLKAERATCDAKIARVEAEIQVLTTKLKYERRIAERDADEIKRLRAENKSLRKCLGK